MSKGRRRGGTAYETLENDGEWASFLVDVGHVEQIQKKQAARIIADSKAGRNAPGGGQ